MNKTEILDKIAIQLKEFKILKLNNIIKKFIPEEMIGINEDISFKEEVIDMLLEEIYYDDDKIITLYKFIYNEKISIEKDDFFDEEYNEEF